MAANGTPLDRSVKNVRGLAAVLPPVPGAKHEVHTASVGSSPMETYVVRMWLPDRPGALGQVASRIGAVRGEIVGIDILERGGGPRHRRAGRGPPRRVAPGAARRRDPAGGRRRRRGGPARRRRPPRPSPRRPRDGRHPGGRHGSRRARAGRGRARPSDRRRGVVGGGPARRRASCWPRRAPSPPTPWLVAFVEGSQSSARVAAGESRSRRRRVVAAAVRLPGPRGRSHGTAYRARERRQIAALARIVDTRLREIIRYSSFRQPSRPSLAGGTP